MHDSSTDDDDDAMMLIMMMMWWCNGANYDDVLVRRRMKEKVLMMMIYSSQARTAVYDNFKRFWENIYNMRDNCYDEDFYFQMISNPWVSNIQLNFSERESKNLSKFPSVAVQRSDEQVKS